MQRLHFELAVWAEKKPELGYFFFGHFLLSTRETAARIVFLDEKKNNSCHCFPRVYLFTVYKEPVSSKRTHIVEAALSKLFPSLHPPNGAIKSFCCMCVCTQASAQVSASIPMWVYVRE